MYTFVFYYTLWQRVTQDRYITHGQKKIYLPQCLITSLFAPLFLYCGDEYYFFYTPL